MPSQSQACWRYIKANTPARLSKCLFISMKCTAQRMKWLDFAQAKAHIKERDNRNKCNPMRCGCVPCLLFLLWFLAASFFLHLLYLIFPSFSYSASLLLFIFPTFFLFYFLFFTTHFTTLLFPPSDTRRHFKGSCLKSVLSHHLFRVLLIYSCHFLILIIERREMFLSYGRKVLAKECWHFWNYGRVASSSSSSSSTAYLFFPLLYATDSRPCKVCQPLLSVAGVICIDWNFPPHLLPTAATRALGCRSVWEPPSVLFFSLL